MTGKALSFNCLHHETSPGPGSHDRGACRFHQALPRRHSLPAGMPAQRKQQGVSERGLPVLSCEDLKRRTLKED